MEAAEGGADAHARARPPEIPAIFVDRTRYAIVDSSNSHRKPTDPGRKGLPAAEWLLLVDIVEGRTRFKANFLQWRITRRARSYRIYVVEPDAYRPEQHGSIFNDALTALVSPELLHADPFAPHPPIISFDDFDLVTFPEAFLPKDDLLSALSGLSNLDSLGCVHVGLRPAMDRDQHLFGVTELSQLVESLARLPKIVGADLTPFSDWLQAQPRQHLFNIGCLFTILESTDL